jgi:membrane protein YqaA with SNARE-associated domain
MKKEIKMQFFEILQRLSEWMNNFVFQYGYFGIFLISVIGAISIVFPIPYTVIIFTLGGLQDLGGEWVFEPLLIAIAAGIGSVVGEFSGYLLGLGGRRIMNERYKKQMDFLIKLFKRFGSITIFLFALTPLPDDLLFIPLGVMRYSLVKALIPSLIGKFCMSLIIAYGGRFSIDIISDIFGVESGVTSTIISMVFGFILLILIVILMFKIDWEKVTQRYLPDKGEENNQD